MARSIAAAVTGYVSSGVGKRVDLLSAIEQAKSICNGTTNLLDDNISNWYTDGITNRGCPVNTGEFELQTDEQHLRALRHDLMNARNLVYALDEGHTIDRHFECQLFGEGMHPRVRKLLDSMDDAIAETAFMLDELDT